MNCYIVVMVMLLVVGLDVSYGKPGDCDYSETASMTNCQFYCGFKTTWATCENNVCCCGYNNGWHAFRYSEGELCGDDKPYTRVPFPPAKCQAICGSQPYYIDDTCCSCIVPDYIDPSKPALKYQSCTTDYNYQP